MVFKELVKKAQGEACTMKINMPNIIVSPSTVIFLDLILRHNHDLFEERTRRSC